MKLTGRFSGDVLSFQVDPPSRTFMLDLTGSCGTGKVPVPASSFIGWADIRFTDGVYEYVVDTPHNAPDTGSTHLELRLKRKAPN